MQVGTYPTMNFATLGPSELQPPFTTGLNSRQRTFVLSVCGTGQVSDPIYHFSIYNRVRCFY